MFHDILSLLESEFGLKNNHLLILEALQHKEKTAVSLVEDTGIPLGRIYGFLNDLEYQRLIHKTSSHPAFYSFHHKKKMIHEFITSKFNHLLDIGAKINSQLEDIEKEESTTVINNSNEFVLSSYSMLHQEHSIKILVRSSSAIPDFYPFDENGLVTIRGAIEETRNKIGKQTFTSGNITTQLFLKFQNYIKQGRKVEYIVTKEGADLFFSIIKKKFGAAKAKERALQIISQLKKYPNSVIYMTTDFVPYNVYLSKTKAQIYLTSGEGFIVGFTSNSRGVVEFYDKLYESIKKRVTPIHPYLRKKLKEFSR